MSAPKTPKGGVVLTAKQVARIRTLCKQAGARVEKANDARRSLGQEPIADRGLVAVDDVLAALNLPLTP